LLITDWGPGSYIFITNKLFSSQKEDTEQKGRKLMVSVFASILYERRTTCGNCFLRSQLYQWMCGYYCIFALPLLFGYSRHEKIANTIFEFIKALLQDSSKFRNYLLSWPRYCNCYYIQSCIAWFCGFLKKKKSERGIKIPGFHADWAIQLIKLPGSRICFLLELFSISAGSGSPVFNSVTIFLGALFTVLALSSLASISGLALTICAHSKMVTGLKSVM